MANSLNRDLKSGDKVVLRGGTVAICNGQCFGAQSYTVGKTLDVIIDGELTFFSGYDIDAAETIRRFAGENGW